MPINLQSAQSLFGNRLNVNAMRPFVGDDGESYILNDKGDDLIRTNAPSTLRYDEFKDIDRTVYEVATDRLVGVADLQAKGLVHNLGGLGSVISQYEKSSDMTEAVINMAGVTAGEKDTPNFETVNVPVPIVHKDFTINIRRLLASRNSLYADSIDTTAAAFAARVVAEKSEDMLFGGSTIKVEDGTIYGYTTAPNRNTVLIGTSWASLTPANNDDIIEDVQSALDLARADKHFGPYTLYVPGNYEGKLDEDYEPGSGDIRTVRERLLQLSGLNEIKVADRLTDDNVVLVQMTRNVVDLAVAQGITTVQWNQQGGMLENFKVMACWAPRVKDDYDGRSGIVHLRTAAYT